MMYKNLNESEFIREGIIENKPVFDSGKMSGLVIKTDTTTPHHYHNISEEHFFVLKGKGRMDIEGKKYELKPNVALSILPGEKHHIEVDEELEILVVSVPVFSKEDEVILE